MRPRVRTSLFAGSLSLLAALSGACAPPAPALDPGTKGPSGPQVTVIPVDVRATPELSPEERFHQASNLIVEGRARDALTLLDALVAEGNDKPTTPPAMVNAGIALEVLGERGAALARWSAMREAFPTHPLVKLSLVRTARVHGYLEQWTELSATADKLLARTDLSTLETVEARGLRAVALVESGKVEEAAKEVDRALVIVEEKQLGQAGSPPMELAAAWFAQGEVRRIRSETITFVPAPPNFATALEQRCQLILDAQSAYHDTLRARDAHWTAMAGFRIGQQYQRLHRDLMAIPPPAAMKTAEDKQLFQAAMRLRFRTLLEKALGNLGPIIEMGERTGEASQWVQRAKAARDEVADALANEKKALAALPYSEDDIRKALAKLQKPKPAAP
jgi:tetratricopeptide (TPR) repeat protein